MIDDEHEHEQLLITMTRSVYSLNPCGSLRSVPFYIQATEYDSKT